MVVFRAGMSGFDEDPHRFYGIIFRAEQFAVMVTGMGESTKWRSAMYEGVQRLISLREGGGIAGIHAVYLSRLPETVRLRNDSFRLTDRARRATLTSKTKDH